MLENINNVFKLRIGFAIMLCALAGQAITAGTPLTAWQMTVLALAVLVSSASAGAFNQYVERDLDALMRRTRGRPFVTGEFRAGWHWLAIIAGLLAVSVGMTALVLNPVSALYVFLGAFVYGGVYTVWLKRRSVSNIVIGGLAGSFAVLAGAAAIAPSLQTVPLLLAVVLFLWTPPHFWSLAMALHQEYADARIPMLPVVIGDTAAAKIILGHTICLVALSLVPFAYGLGWIYLVAAAAGGAYFIYKSILLVRDANPKSAMSNFRASLIQLCLLLVGAIVDGAVSI